METKNFTSKAYFRSLRIIHFALIFGLLLFAAIVIFLYASGSLEKDDSITDVMLIVVGIMALFGFFGNRIIFKSKLKSAKNMSELSDKMNGYRSAFVTRLAIIEGPALFSIIGYQVTGSIYFLGFTGLLIAAFLANKPSIQKACEDLELNHEDSQKLNDPDAIIAEIKLIH
jgi:hypothetical protein